MFIYLIELFLIVYLFLISFWQDDGVDSLHEDLREAIDPELRYNFVEVGTEVTPKPGHEETWVAPRPRKVQILFMLVELL